MTVKHPERHDNRERHHLVAGRASSLMNAGCGILALRPNMEGATLLDVNEIKTCHDPVQVPSLNNGFFVFRSQEQDASGIDR